MRSPCRHPTLTADPGHTGLVALRQAVSGLGTRVLSIADLPGDDDDVRLRKRMGVAAALITIVAPLSLPFETPNPIGWVLTLGLSAYSVLNLVVLARTRRF